MPTNEITTMVCFHDLLGFGDMVSVSGGTFASAVGEIAHKRINMLRETVSEVASEFPEGTVLFQMNDSAVAVCDLDFDIGSMHIDAASIRSKVASKDVTLKALHFVCASAKLHHRTIQKEHDGKIGPAGRSFVVLGKRWPVDSHNDKVTDVPELQANLAFSEAYMADSLGAKAGFSNRAWDSIYINDLMWFLMSTATLSLLGRGASLSENLVGGKNGSFPENLRAPNSLAIETMIFHRKRTFHSVMSHHAIDISKVLTQGE